MEISASNRNLERACRTDTHSPELRWIAVNDTLAKLCLKEARNLLKVGLEPI
jgi:hypothetical protein